MLGCSVAPIAATIEAAETGYGIGGYGEAGYGAGSENELSPSGITEAATDITETSATLNGEVTALGETDAVDAYFGIGRASSSTRYTTSHERLTTAKTLTSRSTAWSATRSTSTAPSRRRPPYAEEPRVKRRFECTAGICSSALINHICADEPS